ncbi:type 4a pilus biogenesis protein PilO [Candidatus Parcubacteria bacterium]|nr:type 4a pilus biogenesis protein PilO [Candidatus Parcubacteria bacterium]
MKNSTAFILFLISVGLTYTFTMPEWAKIAELQAQASSYRSVLDNVKNLEAKRDQLLVQYKNIPPEQIAQLEKILPNNVDTVSLALDLDAIASHYGISLKSVQTSTSNQANPDIFNVEGAPSAPYETVDVAIQFTSTYDNFRKFMADVEKSLRIIDVQSVEFKVGANNLYDYKVSIQTYWTK